MLRCVRTCPRPAQQTDYLLVRCSEQREQRHSTLIAARGRNANVQVKHVLLTLQREKKTCFKLIDAISRGAAAQAQCKAVMFGRQQRDTLSFAKAVPKKAGSIASESRRGQHVAPL